MWFPTLGSSKSGSNLRRHSQLARRNACGPRAFEPLENRRLLALTVTRAGAAPDFQITFLDDSSGIVDTALEWSFNAAGELTWSANGSAFTNDLDTTVAGTQSAAFDDIDEINIFFGVGDDSLTVQLDEFEFNVGLSQGPFFGGPLPTVLFLGAEEFNTGFETNISSVEFIELSGDGGDDDFQFNLNFGSAEARIARGVGGGDRIDSSYLPPVEFFNMASLTFDGINGPAIQKVTLETSSLSHAEIYRIERFQVEDTIIFEGVALDDQWRASRTSADEVTVVDVTSMNTFVVDNSFVNNALPAAIEFRGLGGDDRLEIDIDAATTAGVIANPLIFSGGVGDDALSVAGAPSTAIDGVLMHPGKTGNQLALDYFAGGTTIMEIALANVESAVDQVLAAELIVDGTDQSDIFALRTGTRTVTVNKFTPLTYANKSIVTLRGLAGNDTYGVQNTANTNLLAAVRIADGSTTDEDRLVLSSMGKFARATTQSIRATGKAPITYSQGGLERMRFGSNTLVDIDTLVKLTANNGGTSFPNTTRTLTFKNKSDITLEGPFVAVFRVPSGVTVTNRTSVTQFVTPGRAFIRFNLPAGRLEPSTSVNLSVSFHFANTSAFNDFRSQGFRVDLFAGQGAA